MLDAFRVRLTAESLSDIQHIHEYVNRDSSQNATRLIERLIHAIDSLESMPSRFRRVGYSKNTGSPIHSVVIQPFILYYKIDQDPHLVTILTLRHGKRKQPRRFA